MNSYYLLMHELRRIYRAIDNKTRIFQIASGARCLPDCGVCCLSPEIEATVLECLPIANEIFRRGEEEGVYSLLESRAAQGDPGCVIYHPDESVSGNGRCSYYRVRPLICRLFGFSARRNKYSRMELCLCKLSRENAQKKPVLHTGSLKDIDLPVYQDFFMQISGLSPATGCRLQPINTAIKQALEYVYWKRPKTSHKIRKAA